MQTITEKIKTLADVGSVLNIDIDAVAAAIHALPVPEKDKQYLVHHFNWTKIVEALNEGWTADYTDGNQDKYWPYAWVKKDNNDPSGFGFSCTYATWTYTLTAIGARLLFKSGELARYAVVQFPETYKGCHLEKVEA